MTELARRAGIHETTIKRIEQGDNTYFDSLIAVAAGLEVEIHELTTLADRLHMGSVSMPKRRQKTAKDVAAFRGMGLAITRLRTEQGLAKVELAEKAGLTLNELHLIEAGKEEAQWGTLRDLAYALGVPLPALFSLGEQMEQPAEGCDAD